MGASSSMLSNTIRKYKAIQKDFETAANHSKSDTDTKREIVALIANKYFITTRSVQKILKIQIDNATAKQQVAPNQISLFNNESKS